MLTFQGVFIYFLFLQFLQNNKNITRSNQKFKAEFLQNLLL